VDASNGTITTGGGNDTVILTQAATNTINTGAGNDRVTLLGASNFVNNNNAVTATAGVGNVAAGNASHGDVITTGAGVDTVVFQSTTLANMLAVSAGATRIVSIRDFTVGVDKIAFVGTTNVVTGIAFSTSSTIATADTLQQVYDGITAIGVSTAGGALSASIVTVSAGSRAGTYLYVNDATGAVAAASDTLINITGISGTLTASDFVFA